MVVVTNAGEASNLSEPYALANGTANTLAYNVTGTNFKSRVELTDLISYDSVNESGKG